MQVICRPTTEDDLDRVFTVKRSCGADRVIECNQREDKILRLSWNYWEARGLEHPEKKHRKAINYFISRRGVQ